MPKMTQEVADKAAAIGERYQRIMQGISADGSLSSSGKQQRMAAEHVRLASEMQRVRSDFLGASRRTVATASRSLFGQLGQVSGADAISLRDAADRASQIKSSQEALSLYTQADHLGDEHLARAVVQHAYEMAKVPLSDDGWTNVLQQHADRTPGFAERFQEMEDARAEAGQNVFNEAHFYLTKPSEIANLADHQLEAMAGQSQPSGVA